MADGLHEMGLAEPDAAVDEERVVSLRWALGDGLRGRLRELVTASDDEGVELIARVQLRGGVPIEARLLGAGGQGAAIATARSVLAVTRLRSKAAVLADTYGSLLRRHLEDNLVDLETEVVNGFADQIAVSVADMLELFGGNSYVEGTSADVGEARRFQPRLKALAVDFFLERTRIRTHWFNTAAGTGTNDIV